MSVDLIAIGEVLLDVVAPRASGRVTHAPVSVRAGGVPVNVARSAARAGARAAVVGRVGDDAASAAIERELADEGIAGHLAHDPALPTGTFLRAGDRVVADRGASAALTADDLPDPLAAGVVVVSGYALLHEDTRPAAREALERAAAEHVALVAPAASLVSRVDPATFHRLAEGATALFLNAEEAQLLTGAGPREACVELGRRYPLACVTDGPAGAFLGWDGSLTHLPAAGEPADTTGAGDAFAGSLLTRLLRGGPL